MSLPVATGSGFGRLARHSEEYVADIQNVMTRLGGR